MLNARAVQSLLFWCPRVVGGWALALAVLFGLGLALSRLQLVMLARSAGRAEESSKLERLGLGAYEGVLLALIGFFYASIPLCGALVLLVGAAASALFFTVGPMYLVALCAVGTFMGFYALIRGLLFRRPELAPGRPLSRGVEPELYGLCTEVAAQLGTAPIDAIYLTPGTEIAVALLRGRRTLILGWAALHGLTVQQLRAILAHEYGHFLSGDLKLSGLVRQVELSLLCMLRGMAEVGRGVYLNPAYWMLHLFLVLYRRVTLGWSRLREVMADRGAAQLYGGEAFAQGLAHVIRQGATFDGAVAALLRRQADEQGEPLPSVYALLAAPSAALDLAQIDQAASAALWRSARDDESHPAPAQRAEWTRRYPGVLREEAPAPVMALVQHRAALERLMTSEMDRRVRQWVTTRRALRR